MLKTNAKTVVQALYKGTMCAENQPLIIEKNLKKVKILSFYDRILGYSYRNDLNHRMKSALISSGFSMFSLWLMLNKFLAEGLLRISYRYDFSQRVKRALFVYTI